MVNGTPQPETKQVPGPHLLIVPGRRVIYYYQPKSDITVQELALLWPFFGQGLLAGISNVMVNVTHQAAFQMVSADQIDSWYEALSPEVQRHIAVQAKPGQNGGVATPAKAIYLPQSYKGG